MRALIYIDLPKVVGQPGSADTISHAVVCPDDVKLSGLQRALSVGGEGAQQRRYMSRGEFRCMMQWLGWEPGRMYVDVAGSEKYDSSCAESETGGGDTPPQSASGYAENEEEFRRYFVSLAQPILARVPLSTPDSHEKRRTAELNIIYASQLPQTSTPFMATLEGNGNVLFRLMNSRLEELRAACDYLISSLKKYNREHPHAPVVILPTIKILEHDLEHSTITGQYRPRWTSIIWKYAGVNFALFTVFAVVSILLWVSRLHLKSPQDDELISTIDRFLVPAASGMLTALVTLVYTIWERSGLIDWNFSDLRVKK